jgi:1-acyl-sn-glycerol-3-phosphate acyltransferase
VLDTAAAESALPAADLLPVGPKANLPYRLIRLLALPLLHLLFRFDVAGPENIPRQGNYIVIANHLNWLDEFTLLMLFPVEPHLHFLAEPTILVTRKVQWWIVRHVGGYVPVVKSRHGDRVLFHHVDRCLAIGGAVAIFPEGRYGTDEGVLCPFHKGFAHFAIKAGVPVIPVALSGCKDLWLGKKIKVVIGKALSSTGTDPATLTEVGYQSIKTLMPAYVEPAGRKLMRKKLTHLF